MELSFKEIVDAINGEILVENEEKNFNDICTDTRKILKGNIFLALKGENFNGNKYAKDALEKGASISIIDEDIENINECKNLGTVIKVKDGNEALLSLAKYYRKKLGIKVVGITGSTGKTSTKDVVASFLSGKYKVFKTKGNFNNHIGLPLMILQLDSSYDVAVLELGMSHLGEIHRLAECARPDIALITNIGLSHIENLKTRENIFKAKMEITDFFDENNVLIVNGEDDFLPSIKNKKYKVIKTGYKDEFDFKGKNVVLNENSTSFTVEHNGEESDFNIPMVGAHNVLNSLLAVAAANELKVTFHEMKEGLKNIEATSMRLEFIKKNGFEIINDCYNASPSSMKAAIDVLKNRKGSRKIAILGTMNELGEEAENSHKLVGSYAKDKVDILITTGKFKEAYKSGFEKDSIRIYNTKEEIIEDLKNIIQKDDVVLVKASRGIKFEDITKALEKVVL